MVSDSDRHPQIGQVVRMTQGRDRGQLAIVIRNDHSRFVWVADGEKRKFDSCKKKNRNHIYAFEHISPEVKDSMEEAGRVTNGKLRYALHKFKEMIEDEAQKGE